MSRWRPPAPKSTAIITRAGFERLKQELDHLWHHLRPEVVEALAAAAAEGDRSENAEYSARKKQLGQIDRRVRYLSKRLPELRVVDALPADRSKLYFGAEVELLDESEGKTVRQRIVGPDETDARAGWISIDAPLARALLGKQAGDQVEIELVGHNQRWSIVSIAYPDPV